MVDRETIKKVIFRQITLCGSFLLLQKTHCSETIPPLIPLVQKNETTVVDSVPADVSTSVKTIQQKVIQPQQSLAQQQDNQAKSATEQQPVKVTQTAVTVEEKKVSETDAPAQVVVSVQETKQSTMPPAPSQQKDSADQIKQDMQQKKADATKTVVIEEKKVSIIPAAPTPAAAKQAQQVAPTSTPATSTAQEKTTKQIAEDIQPKQVKTTKSVTATEEKPLEQQEQSVPKTSVTEPQQAQAVVQEPDSSDQDEQAITEQQKIQEFIEIDSQPAEQTASQQEPKELKEQEQQDAAVQEQTPSQQEEPQQEVASEQPVVSEVEKQEITETTVDQPAITQPATPVEPEDESKFLDTIDIEEGGNWLLKRKALEDTVDLIESINRLFTKILESSTNYKINRNKLDSEYDTFTAAIGFDLGDVNQVFEQLLENLDKERQQQGDLSANERELIETINEKKKQVEQLREDFKTLNQLDDEIDGVIDTVDEQIKLANTYQNQAWNNFQVIKRVLSDEKAEDLYYKTEGLYKNIQDIQAYFAGPLLQYFNEQAQALRNQITKIKSSVATLQQKGIDLQQEFKKLAQEDEQEAQKVEQAQEQEALRKAIAQAQAKTSWWQTIKNGLMAPFRYIYSIFYGAKPATQQEAAISKQE